MAKFYLLSNRISFICILGLMVFIPLYPKFPLLSVSGTYVAVRIEDILIAMTGGFWFFSKISRIRKYLKQSIYQSFLVYWLIGLFSLISGAVITYSIIPHLSLLHWLRRVEMMMLFIICATIIKSKQDLWIILRVMFFVTLIVVLYGFGQIYFGFPVISTTNREFSKGLLLKLTPEARANSTFAGHYDLAVYLSVALIFFSTMFFYLDSFRKKIIMAVVALAAFVLLGFTAARLSFVTALAGITLNFWLLKKRLLIGGLVIASLFVVAFVPELRHRLVATVTVNLMQGGGPKYQPPANQINIFTRDNILDPASKSAVIRESIEESTQGARNISTVSADIAPGEPVNTTELGVYRSFNIRLQVEWPRVIRSFLRNPLFGTGYSSIDIATDNDILRALGETGLLGLLGLMLIFFIYFKDTCAGFRAKEGLEKYFIISTLSAAFAFIATSLVIDVFEASKVASLFWMMLGVSWAVTRNYKDAE